MTTPAPVESEPAIEPTVLRVFFVPTAAGGHELYYEPSEGQPAPEAGEDDQPGLWRRWRARFSQMLHEAEQEQQLPSQAHQSDGILARGRRRMMKFVVERIAEWRLLWHLRTADRVDAFTTLELSSEAADEFRRRTLKADGDRHLRWTVINLVLLVVSGLLALVPGPNLLAYLFTFNLVGHFLAMRGARRGLSDVSWHYQPSEALSELKAALTLSEPHRVSRVHDLSERLHLQHLVRFVERVAAGPA